MELEIGVSLQQHPSDMIFCESVESSHSSHTLSNQISRELKVEQDPIRMDSQCKYALVASGFTRPISFPVVLGDADAYMRLPVNSSYEEKIWVCSYENNSSTTGFSGSCGWVVDCWGGWRHCYGLFGTPFGFFMRANVEEKSRNPSSQRLSPSTSSGRSSIYRINLRGGEGKINQFKQDGENVYCLRRLLRLKMHEHSPWYIDYSMASCVIDCH